MAVLTGDAALTATTGLRRSADVVGSCGTKRCWAAGCGSAAGASAGGGCGWVAAGCPKGAAGGAGATVAGAGDGPGARNLAVGVAVSTAGVGRTPTGTGGSSAATIRMGPGWTCTVWAGVAACGKSDSLLRICATRSPYDDACITRCN